MKINLPTSLSRSRKWISFPYDPEGLWMVARVSRLRDPWIAPIFPTPEGVADFTSALYPVLSLAKWRNEVPKPRPNEVSPWSS